LIRGNDVILHLSNWDLFDDSYGPKAAQVLHILCVYLCVVNRFVKFRVKGTRNKEEETEEYCIERNFTRYYYYCVLGGTESLNRGNKKYTQDFG
jgi:hypothetical protein